MSRYGSQEPCDCVLVNDPRIGPHTTEEHWEGMCGAQPCGGCYPCLVAQHHYALRLERLAVAEGPSPEART